MSCNRRSVSHVEQLFDAQGVTPLWELPNPYAARPSLADDGLLQPGAAPAANGGGGHVSVHSLSQVWAQAQSLSDGKESSTVETAKCRPA